MTGDEVPAERTGDEHETACEERGSGRAQLGMGVSVLESSSTVSDSRQSAPRGEVVR